MITINISKADKPVSIDWDSLPKVSQQHIIEYGLRQKLNDAGSQFTTKELGEAEAGKRALEVAENVIAALKAGNISQRQSKGSATLEQRMFAKVLRDLWKQVTKGKLTAEDDTSNEALLETLSAKTGKDVETLTAAIESKANALAELERQAAAMTIEL